MPQNQNQQPIVHNLLGPGGQPVNTIIGARRQFALRYNIAGWQYNLWDGNGWVLCPTQDHYNVPIFVKGFMLQKVSAGVHESVCILQYDLAGYGEQLDNAAVTYQTRVENTLPTLQNIPAHVGKRIYLSGDDVNTDFTEAYFWG